MKNIFFLTTILISFAFSQATLSKDATNGTYHFGTPERGKTSAEIQITEYNGQTVLAVQADKRMQPAVYTYLAEESKTLGRAIFTTSGLYLIQYNDESFVLLQPDGVLGRKVWQRFGYTNIYSKNAQTAKTISKAAIEAFAKKLSNTIMNQDVGTMAHSGGTYYLAVPQKHSGKAQSEYTIEFKTDGKKQINITPCGKCDTDEYTFLADESAITQVDIYRHATSYYLFDIGDGILIYTFANGGGLGRNEWGKGNNYNVYSNNQNYIRQILASKEKQNTIDNMMKGYFASIKDTFIKRARDTKAKKDANRTLPKTGLADQSQRKQALAAAKRWGESWNWKETIKDAYFTSADWTITRNRLTGVITGKVIRGYITMTHPDGRCRFQTVTYRQDFDGSDYMNFHMTGVGPIYDLKCGEI